MLRSQSSSYLRNVLRLKKIIRYAGCPAAGWLAERNLAQVAAQRERASQLARTLDQAEFPHWHTARL